MSRKGQEPKNKKLWNEQLLNEQRNQFLLKLPSVVNMEIHMMKCKCNSIKNGKIKQGCGLSPITMDTL